MIKLAFIACDHGFGHTRRVLEIIKFMSNNNHSKIDLFASKKIIIKLLFNNLSLLPDNVKIIDFETKTTLDYDYFVNPFGWLDRLPDIKSYDRVISDNLIEVLSLRNDTIISGSFFWHYAISKYQLKDYKFLEELIIREKPIVIGLEGFSDRIMKNKNIRYHPTGFVLNNLKPLLDYRKKKGILITGGKSRKIDHLFAAIINDILNNYSLFGYDLWIDSNIADMKFNDRIKLATFDDYMFNNLIAAVARPGIGIITESIKYGFILFPVYENENEEMKQNAYELLNKGLGIKYDNLSNCIYDYLSSEEKISKYYSLLSKINIDGLDTYNKIIIDSIGKS
jgi:hypothetical protein